MNNCTENFLEDIVKVQLVRHSNLSCAIPKNVGGIKEALFTVGDPDIGFSLIYDSDDEEEYVEGQMSKYPDVKVSSKREDGGIVYTHEVQITLDSESAVVLDTLHRISSKDVHIIYTKANGDKYVSYTLQNTCVLTTEDKQGSDMSVSIKITARSLSGLIKA